MKQTISTKNEKANISRTPEFLIFEQVKETTFSNFSTSFIGMDPRNANQLMSSAIQDPAYEYHHLGYLLNLQQIDLSHEETAPQQNELTIVEQGVQENVDSESSQTLRDADSLGLESNQFINDNYASFDLIENERTSILVSRGCFDLTESASFYQSASYHRRPYQFVSSQFINDNYGSCDFIENERPSILVSRDAFDLTQDTRSNRQSFAFSFIDNKSSCDLIENERSSILVVRDPSSLATSDASSGVKHHKYGDKSKIDDLSVCDLIENERSSILVSQDASISTDCKMSFQVSNEIFV